jgi:phosphate transport system ATP-binding protein
VWYGHQAALRHVTLTVEEGSVLAVIGPSGCGKSTLLRVLNRLVDRVPGVRLEGRVFLGDWNILDPQVDLAALRRRVGMVFQTPNPFPFSIYDNVAYGPRLHGVRDPARLRAVVEASLRQAALWDEVRGKLRRPAASLSGGQQQRLCLARALAVGPDVLLMDEPTSALDPVSTARIEELITALKGRYTILLVTHNLQQAARVSDQTAFFQRGELVEVGPTPVIFTAPRDRRTEDYLTGRAEG